MTPHPQTDWPALIRRFPATRVLVVGDIMLDRYWYGAVSRVSPEAPVVVISKTHAVVTPGGAANTAVNIAALGGQVSLVGVCGCDAAASELRAALASRGVEAAHLLEDAGRPTTVKTRVVAHQQHVVRIDEESTAPLDGALEGRLLETVSQFLGEARAVVLSDYAKGVLGEGCVQGILGRARHAGVPVFVDPKARHAARYRGAALLKPNRLELGVLTNSTVSDRASTLAAGAKLLEALPGTAVLTTEGAEGMTLLRPGCEPVSFAGRARALYDVTGAGDTVIATLALAVAAGCDWLEAASLANHAAAQVIGKLGTAPCTAEELLDSLTLR
jgi:D-beta-D-heptose 7-phosphate kinase/D-beta-D-heptose 1-phosphate adenosyltransferase